MGWKPPGQKPTPHTWNYDFQRGWGVGAGQDGGMQFEMPSGQYPGPDAPMPNLLASPPGVPAPMGGINYTPGTGEMHGPGEQAPIDQHNLTMMPPAGGMALPSAGGVDQGMIAQGLRGGSTPTNISPLRQAREMMALLGVNTEDENEPPPVGQGQAVGVGSALDGQGVQMPTLQSMAQSLIAAGFPPYAVYQAIQGLQNGGQTATPTQQPGTTQSAGPQDSSYDPFRYNQGNVNPPTDPRFAGATGSVHPTPGQVADSPEHGKVMDIRPVTGGYVPIYEDGSVGEFISTSADKAATNAPSALGDGYYWNPTTGKIERVPQDPKDPSKNTPTALGGGYYWNPTTGSIEQVDQSQQPGNNQIRDNGDGTWSVIDPDTGEVVSAGGKPKKTPATILPGERGGYTAIDPDTGEPIYVQHPGDKNEPTNPLQTPTGDIVTWNPATGQYETAYQQTRYILNDGSLIDVQPDGSLKYVYKGKHEYTTPKGDVISEDPETGQFTMPFAMPEQQAPGWEVRSIQKMFPDVFTPEALVGPEFTSQQPGGDPWRPDVPGPVRGAGANGSSPGYSSDGLSGLMGQMQSRGSNFQPETYDGFPIDVSQFKPNAQPKMPTGGLPNPWDMSSGGGPVDGVYDAGRGPGAFDQSYQQQLQGALGWNPFAGKSAPSWMGAGQDVGAGQGFTPPVDPQSVVGTGHRWMEPVGMEGQHKGVDLQAVRGTPVMAPVDGTISRIENDPAGLGIQVFVQGSDGVEHGMGHMDTVGVQIGDPVSMGDEVGTVGSTGAGSTGPHLDYRQIDAQGQHLDPTAQLGPLAQMPRADDGSEPTGMGQDYPWGMMGTEMPDVNTPFPEQSPFGTGQDVGVGVDYTQTGVDSFQPWVQLYYQNEQARRQYELDQQQAYQNWLIHQDNIQYQKDALAAQTKFQNAQLQQQAGQPFVQAALDNPWLTRLKGMTPNYGQVGGPGGPWAARLGASEQTQDMLAASGQDPWPDHFPGWGKPDKRGKLGLNVPIADVGQAQTAYDPLKYTRTTDQRFTPEQIARAGNGRKSSKHIPNVTPPEGAPAGAENAFKWTPVEQLENRKKSAIRNNQNAGKFAYTAQGGVDTKAVRKGNVPWNVYAEMSPFQRAALRTDVGLNQKSWGDYTNQLRTNWGASGGPTEMPGMTMMHSMSQSPTQSEGTSQLVDTFGQTPDQYYKQQQKLWTKAAATSVSQSA